MRVPGPDTALGLSGLNKVNPAGEGRFRDALESSVSADRASLSGKKIPTLYTSHA
jgi:hypothetical protein